MNQLLNNAALIVYHSNKHNIFFKKIEELKNGLYFAKAVSRHANWHWKCEGLKDLETEIIKIELLFM